MVERVDQAKLLIAKELFLGYKSVPDIVEATGLNERTLRYHIQHYWNPERNLVKEEFFGYIVDNKKVQLVNITNKALIIIEKSLQDLCDKDTISIREARVATEILEKIDKILKLDEGKATSISTTAAPSNIVELKKRLRIDPFVQIGDDENEKSDSTSSDSRASESSSNPSSEQ